MRGEITLEEMNDTFEGVDDKINPHFGSRCECLSLLVRLADLIWFVSGLVCRRERQENGGYLFFSGCDLAEPQVFILFSRHQFSLQSEWSPCCCVLVTRGGNM